MFGGNRDVRQGGHHHAAEPASPCLTTQYGPRKFKPCPSSSSCQRGRPPMPEECESVFEDENATDITSLGERKFCYNGRNNVNGWCIVADDGGGGRGNVDESGGGGGRNRKASIV